MYETDLLAGCGSIDCLATPAATASEQRALATDSKHPGDPALLDLLGLGRETAAGEMVDEQTALTCAAVFAAVRVLAETVAFLPWKVYRRLPDRGKEEAIDHPLYRVLHDVPNGEMAAYNFRETLQAHLATWGNAYAEIQRTRSGKIHALWPIKPHRVRPKRLDTGQLVYEVDQPRGGQKTLRRRDMFHIAGLGYDGIVGYSPISLQKEAIGRAMGADRFAAEATTNSPTPSGFLEHPGTLGEKAQERWNTAMKKRAAHGGRHRVLLLEEGMKFASSMMKPQDVQMIQTRRFNIEDIARIYRIPPSLLQDLTRGTFSNITELGRQFIRFTMSSWLCRWCGAANAQLLDSSEYFCEFTLDAFLQADPKTRSEVYRNHNGMGVYTINEIRAKENMNPIGPEGDRRFVPLNMVPLEHVDDIYGDQAADDQVDDDATDDQAGDDEPSQRDDRHVAIWKQMRSVCKRQYRHLFRDAARRTLRRGENAVCGAAKRHLQRAEPNHEAFDTWAASFADKHETYLRNAWQPVIDAYASTMAAIQAGSIDLAGEPSARFREALLRFADGLARNHCNRMIRRLPGPEPGVNRYVVIAHCVSGWDASEWCERVMDQLSALVTRHTCADAGGYDPDDPTLPTEDDEGRDGWLQPRSVSDDPDDPTLPSEDEDEYDDDPGEAST